MSEQLNEREKWIALRFWCAGGGDLIGDADTFGSLVQEFDDQGHKTIPPDPNLARITELEAEVERLNGLLDEFEAALKAAMWSIEAALDADDRAGIASCTGIKTAPDAIRKTLSRRTAERKEPTDASD